MSNIAIAKFGIEYGLTKFLIRIRPIYKEMALVMCVNKFEIEAESPG